MPPTYRGDLNPKRRRFVERYSPNSGLTREIEWRGFDAKKLQSYARDYANQGCEYELGIVDDIGVLSAVDHTGEITVDTWEVGLNKLSPSVLEHPTMLKIIENSGAANVKAVTAAIKQAVEGSEDYADIPALLLVPTTGGQRETMFRFLDMARRQQSTYYKFSYVLRHTTNVSGRYQKNVSDTNVGHIYTTAHLLSEVQDPELWVYPLPGRLTFKLLAIEEPEVRTGYLWGWLKSGSPEGTSANGRVNIVTEYELGQWGIPPYKIAT